jgi:predicted ATPase
LLSDSARDQIKNRSDVAVVSLGRFKLKNVGRPFEVYAVAAEGLSVPDPAVLEGKGERFATIPVNLPDPGARLLGREDVLAALVELVQKHRLVTISGPGGVGKTRILVELGRTFAAESLDGVAFVPLAEVTDPDDFLPALADALDVKEAEERTLGEGIVSLIGDGRTLLLLDNLEQIVSAAPEIGRLIERCPALRIVATSRTPLRIAAEHEFPLAPLDLDPAVALLVERARKAKGSFELTAENAGPIEDVCRRLDGLPLALELAAARLRLLSPEALLERLDHALDVLTSGPRDSPERQQTLRATIDWSHSLLTDAEQRLLRRMAVFAGGCRFEDVEAVCEAGLDELESLVDKALVRSDGHGNRLLMLETIREFARERLEAAGEAEELALRHAGRYAELAREVRDGIEGTGQLQALELCSAEEPNIEAALETLAAAVSADDAAREQGLQLCGDLWMYWHIRGKHLTARAWSTAFLEAGGESRPTVGRAGALITAGLASWTLGQYERANDEWADAYRIASELDVGRELCLGATIRGAALLFLDPPAGLEWVAEGAERSRAAGFSWSEALATALDGILRTVTGDLEGAQERYSQALAVQRRLDDHEGGGLSRGGLAQLAVLRGDHGAGLELYGQALESFQTIGDRAEEARILSEIAWTHLAAGDSARARSFFLESVQAYTELASVRGIGLSLIGLAAAASAEDRPETALQIAAAAELYAQQEGIVNVYSDETPGREYVDRARAALPPEEAARAAELGRRLSIDDVLAMEVDDHRAAREADRQHP